MTTADDLEALKLDIVLAKGFGCHVRNSTGLVFCEECGITYHCDMLKQIYK